MATSQKAVTAILEDNNTIFSCHSDNAAAVFLAASFNGWSSTETPMMRQKGGDWTASIPLAPGHYEYRFVVDGEWCCEPGCTSKTVHCAHCVMNEDGAMSRVLEVQ